VSGKQKFYYTYVLRSIKDNKLYTGWTDNLKTRVTKRNNGLVQSTKTRGPFVLVYFEGCLSRSKAIKREKVLKTGFGRKYLKLRIN